MVNPKAVYNRVQVDIWSDTGGKDDVHCYTMKKNAEGTWRVEILTGYLSHYGTCYAECFYGKTSLSTKKFTVSKEDHDASKNTLVVGGSGVSRAIRLSNPASSYKNVYAAVWSQEGGQDDMKWLASKTGRRVMEIERWLVGARQKAKVCSPQNEIVMGRDIMEDPENLVVGIVAETREECNLIQKAIAGWQPPTAPKYRTYIVAEQ
jgi:hypothetical protein